MTLSAVIGHESSQNIGGAGHIRGSVFATRYVQCRLHKHHLPDRETPKEAAYQIIGDELMLDGNSCLNLASFATNGWSQIATNTFWSCHLKQRTTLTWMSTLLPPRSRCVNMIASLFNALLEDGTQAIGTGTVGSLEAMLAGLAFRHNWQNKQKVAGLPYDKPNMVTGANVQVVTDLNKVLENLDKSPTKLIQAVSQAVQEVHATLAEGAMSEDVKISATFGEEISYWTSTATVTRRSNPKFTPSEQNAN
ncbi:unnamed protein product [Sphagnum compactum]